MLMLDDPANQKIDGLEFLTKAYLNLKAPGVSHTYPQVYRLQLICVADSTILV